jgi:hypothetical protein
MPGLQERRNNLIVRTRAVNLVQLDDLDAEKLKPLAGVAFIVWKPAPASMSLPGESGAGASETTRGLLARQQHVAAPCVQR